MSTFAFGTLNISDQNPIHIEALKEAVTAGINTIVTATNYSNGGAEKAIGNLLRYSEDPLRKEIKIISKYGYIQGSALENLKKEDFNSYIKINENFYYSIEREFQKQELTKSLQRLDVDKIDCYLINNPQYILEDAISKNISKDEMLDMLYEKLYEAFIGLEEEVQNGRINSYGITSFGFSKNIKDNLFLPYEDLLVLAQKAADEIDIANHHFTTIELPINIVNQDGLKCAKWAKNNNLRVLASNPLTAEKNNLMFRLADYDYNKDYDYALNELLEICEDPLLNPLYNLIDQLDSNKHKFGWIGEYDIFLTTQIIPHIKKSLENIDAKVLDDLLYYIENFLNQYRKIVAYECSLRLRVELKETLKDCNSRIQDCALNFLLNQDNIDLIVVGMKKPTYVQEIVALNS